MLNETVLNDVKICRIRIAQREKERAELENVRNHIRPETYSRISRNITEAIRADRQRIEEIKTIIKNHPHELQRTILYLKYLKGMHLLDIAEKLNYCDRYIYYEHAKAIKTIKETGH